MAKISDTVVVGEIYGDYRIIGRGPHHPTQPTKVRSIIAVNLKTEQVKEFTYYMWSKYIDRKVNKAYLYMVINLTDNLVTHGHYTVEQDAKNLLPKGVQGLVIFQPTEQPATIAYRRI